MSRVAIGLDIGTGSTKGIAVTRNGRVLARAWSKHGTDYGANGEAEQDPKDWLRGCNRVTRELLRSGSFSAQEVEGIGLGGQIRTLLLTDGDGRPVRPAILWFDPRFEKVPVDQDSTISNSISTHTALAKLLWVREHEREIYFRARHVLSPKDFVKFHLTGEMTTDASDASGSGLLDLRTRRWSSPLIQSLGLDREWFPPIQESTAMVRGLSRRAADRLGLLSGTPVIEGGADNACAAVGSGIVDGPSGLCNIGTCAFVLLGLRSVPQEAPSEVEVFCHAAESRWYALGFLLTGGRAIEWASETLLSLRFGTKAMNAAIERALALGVDPNGPIFLPYLEGEISPVPTSLSAAAFVGLRASHSRTDILRCIFEGLGLAIRDVAERMQGLGIHIESVHAAGNLACRDEWCTLLANILGLPVLRSQPAEATEFGAALLAAVGAGMWGSVSDAVSGMVHISLECVPQPGTVASYEELLGRFRQACASLGRS